MQRRSTQTNLFGEFVSVLPKVRTSRGYLLDWDRNRIVKQIMDESRLVEVFYGNDGADEETAQEIARKVERKIQMLGLQSLSGPLIREIVNMTLLEHGLTSYRNVCTRVGTPVFDAHLIDVGRGFEARDNANLQENAETSHKKKADKISKEQYLLQLPPALADHHLRGDLHIHDLEYFGTRPFCIDGSTIVPLREEGRISSTKLDDLPISDDEWCPHDLSALTPVGWRRVIKATRRQTKPGEMIRIRTSDGRSLLVTDEHRVPVNTTNGMAIRRADEIRVGDTLYRMTKTDAIRGETINTIDLVQELSGSVPAHLLEDVYVKGVKEIFSDVVQIGRAASYADISKALRIEHKREWYVHGVMPVSLFAIFARHYGIKDYYNATISIPGNKDELPAVLTLMPEVIRVLGHSIVEESFTAEFETRQRNPTITKGVQTLAIKTAICGDLNSCPTLIKEAPRTTPTCRAGEGHNQQKIKPSGGLAHLVLRYVFGVPDEAAKMRLPWIIYHLDDLLLHEFLSILFTRGGSAYYCPERLDCTVSYTTPSSALRQELSLLLSALGITPQITEIYTGEDQPTLYRLEFAGRRDVETFARYATFLNEQQDHIDNFLSTVKDEQNLEREATVVEVSTADPTSEYVYDLFLAGDGTEESHTFYASDGLLIHNCQDWDLRYFFYYGLMPDGNGTKASVAGPARRAEVAVLHAVKALGSAQTNFAGGQGYYNFLTFMAPYVEGLDYSEIRQLMQMFVYEMTQMMVARGGQVVFSSVQLSPGVPTLWKDKPCVYRGKVWDGKQAPLRTYGEFEREVRLLFKALMEVMLEGDYWGKPFSFPKPEISVEPDFLTEDEDFDKANPDLPTYHDLYLMTFELASKYGTPYYDNQIPPYRGAGEGISCYQCLAGDEQIPVVDSDGWVRVSPIGDLFDAAAKNGRRVDPFGTELVYYDGETPSVNFKTLEASIRPFRGIMRRRYAGDLLRITLESGRHITITPDHPVYVLNGRKFVQSRGADLEPGDHLPVLTAGGLCDKVMTEIDILEIIARAGHSDLIQAAEDEEKNPEIQGHYLPQILSINQDFVEFLGYYLAIGSREYSEKQYAVKLSFDGEVSDLVLDAAACIRAAFGYEPEIHELGKKTEVLVRNKLIYLLVAALGCGSSAVDRNVPDLIFNINRDLIGDYIGAAFRASKENISKRCLRSIRLKTASQVAAQRLILLAREIGVQMSYAEKEKTIQQTDSPKKGYICRITAQDQIDRFRAETSCRTRPALGRESGGPFTHLPMTGDAPRCTAFACNGRYKAGGITGIQVSLFLPPTCGHLTPGDVHPLRIRSIESVECDGYVYDLVDVADNHTFANAFGIVTGNCCAYQFSALADDDDEFEDKLYFQDGKHFSMGSWQVMSINCPRAAYKAEGDQERLFAELRGLMDTAVDLFRIKRRWMSLIRANGRMPFAMQRPKDPNTGERGTVAVDLEGLVYTIGVVGVNEMVQHFTGQQLHESKEAFRLAVRTMTELEMYARELSAKHNMTIALARTPAETTGQRFAVADLLDERFRDHALKVVKGNADSVLDKLGTTLDLPIYYTNGTHVTPAAQVPLTKRIEIEHVFFPIVDGGNIFHIWLGEARPDPRGLMEMAMNLCRTTQIGYFAFTRDLTISLKEFRELGPRHEEPGGVAGSLPAADRADV